MDRSERTTDARPRCWLIADPSTARAEIVAQFAHLRGLEVIQACRTGELIACAPRQMLAASFSAFSAMRSREREKLRALINAGATLLLTGGREERKISLAPLADVSFSLSAPRAFPGYRLTASVLLPAALRRESSPGGVSLSCATDIAGPVAIILLANRNGDGAPVLFAVQCGRGAIVCDLSGECAAESSIVSRLADPRTRVSNIGALIAADLAAGRDHSPVAVNLTIDDLPLGYDYFNVPVLEEFFRHMEAKFPRVHLDGAWIPANRGISRRYVDALKAHRTGFVWHGLVRHVNHREVTNPEAEINAGLDAMRSVEHRYRVDLQPIMIFPFEKAAEAAERQLLKEGFLAGAELPTEAPQNGPSYLRDALPLTLHASGLPFFHRYRPASLTRDMMLAIAALGNPILAFAHPKDVRLRRLQRFIDRGGSYSHFDGVLEFAAEKNLRPRSLHEIALEVRPRDSSAQLAQRHG